MRSLPRSRAARRLLLLAVVCVACGPGDDAPPPTGQLSATAARLLPEPERWDAARPELKELIAGSPHAFFRFINRAWMQEVCSAFGDELLALPAVRLHGDPHVEQYAFTSDAHGLDDFDDSAIGPAVVDLVRFLGSVEIVAFERDWPDAPDRAAAALFDGYRRALEAPGYAPPMQAVIERLRATTSRSHAEFLSWAGSLMEMMSPDEQWNFDAAWLRLQQYAQEADPAFTSDFLRVKRVGNFHLGIGSAMSPKILVRIEGPSSADDDDLVIEGKQVNTMRGVSCLTVASSGEVFRVIEGLSQIGRIHHRLLMVLPLFSEGVPDARGWWVKSWETSYREVTLADLASAEELVELAHDVGAQLGGANLQDVAGTVLLQKRLMELESVNRLEGPIRDVARQLAAATLEAWETARRR